MGPPTEELAGARQDVDLDEGAQGLVASSGRAAAKKASAREAARAEAFFAAASWASALWRRVSEKAAEAAAKASRRASVEAAPRTRASSAMWARLASG